MIEYPEGAVKTQDELCDLIRASYKEPKVLWLTPPFCLPILKIELNKKCRITMRETAKTYTFIISRNSFWLPIGEACIPFNCAETGESYDSKLLGFLFTNYLFAWAYNGRRHKLDQAL